MDERLNRLNAALSRIRCAPEVLDAAGDTVLSRGGARRPPCDVGALFFSGDVAHADGWAYARTGIDDAAFVALREDIPAPSDVLSLAVELVRAVYRAAPDLDRETLLRRVLLEEMDGFRLETQASFLGIKYERTRCVIYVSAQDEGEAAYEALRDAFPDGGEDEAVLLDASAAVLIKACGSSYAEVVELAEAISATASEQSGRPWYIGISEPRDSLLHMREAYLEAKAAMEAGTRFKKGASIFPHRAIPLERFLYESDEGARRRCYDALFGRKVVKQLSDELLLTVDRFFDCSLNMAETARQLYIHRNTLVYRLDKVQKITGLDVRRFDDAVMFKMVMMMGRG